MTSALGQTGGLLFAWKWTICSVMFNKILVEGLPLVKTIGNSFKRKRIGKNE